eukprot:m.132083 g.132083  ORF g.132083 m.132083 type:complete len:65 (-) comp22427_c0_seq1:1093-1287(-)
MAASPTDTGFEPEPEVYLVQWTDIVLLGLLVATLAIVASRALRSDVGRKTGPTDKDANTEKKSK